MTKKNKIIFICSILFAISFCIFKFINSKSELIFLDDGFLINFIGVILGTDVAIITFIYSSLDKIEEHLNKQFSKDDAKHKRMLKLLYSSVKELIDDGKLIFGLFIGILLICVICYIDFPFPILITYTTKLNILKYFKIVVLVFLLYAIYDSITTLFNLIMVTVKSKN